MTWTRTAGGHRASGQVRSGKDEGDWRRKCRPIETRNYILDKAAALYISVRRRALYGLGNTFKAAREFRSTPIAAPSSLSLFLSSSWNSRARSSLRFLAEGQRGKIVNNEDERREWEKNARRDT